MFAGERAAVLVQVQRLSPYLIILDRISGRLVFATKEYIITGYFKLSPSDSLDKSFPPLKDPNCDSLEESPLRLLRRVKCSNVIYFSFVTTLHTSAGR